MYLSEQLKPYGTNGTKREQVERMFNNIANTYDVLNHVLSLGIDRVWRRNAISHLKPFNVRNVLDIATGTGDFAVLAAKMLKPERVTGCDISEGMMKIGKEKVQKLGLDNCIEFKNEDCAHLTLADNTYDAVISAFALRNFQDIEKCLSEMHRVTAPGGHLSVIDLCAPVSFPMKQLFGLYKKTIMPVLGKLFCKDGSAYSYLPESMDAVPQAERMQDIITRAGFRNANYRRLIFGMCILYTAEK